MRECTYCPPSTKQCAHLDGRWARIVYDKVPSCIDNLHEHPEYGVFWSWPPAASDIGFYYDTFDKADEWFQDRNAEMRKIASEEPGDVCT